MKVKVINSFNLNEAGRISEIELKNFKKYITAVFNWRLDPVNGTGQNPRKLKVVLRFNGTGNRPGLQGILVFDPIKDKNWIDTKQGILDCNKSKILEKDKWNSKDENKQFPIVKLDYTVDRNNENAEDTGSIYILDKNNNTVFYTFTVEEFG